MSKTNSVNFNTPFNRTVAENLDQLAIKLVSYFLCNKYGSAGLFSSPLNSSVWESINSLLLCPWENVDEIRQFLVPSVITEHGEIITIEGLAAKQEVDTYSFVQQLREDLNKPSQPVGLFVLYLMEPYIRYKRDNIKSYPAAFVEARGYWHFLDNILQCLESFRSNPIEFYTHTECREFYMDNLVRLMSNFTLTHFCFPSLQSYTVRLV